PRRHVDLVAFGEPDDRFLDVLLLAAHAAERLGLALAQDGVDGQHLDLEQLLDGSLDLGLGRVAADLEYHLVRFGSHARLLGDDRREDDVVCGERTHLNRASSASTAALVRTSLSWLRMS